MATSQQPQNSGPLAALGKTPSDAEAEALFNQAKKYAIPLAVIAVVVIGWAFASTASQEAVRKANAAAYAELAKAAEFDAPFEQDEAKIAENRSKQREIYNRVIADHPDALAATDAKFQLAALELSAGNFELAEKLFGELVAADLSGLQADVARTGHANALVGLERFDDAVKVFAELGRRSDSPFALDSKYRAAIVAYRQGDFATTKTQLDDILAADDASADVKRLAEQFLERLEYFDAATVKESFQLTPEAAEDSGATDGEDGDAPTEGTAE